MAEKTDQIIFSIFDEHLIVQLLFVDVNILPTLERTNVIYRWKGQKQTFPMVPRTHTYTKVMSIQTPIETCMQKPRFKKKILKGTDLGVTLAG